MRLLGIASLICATTACTSNFDCYSDRACGEGRICDAGVCISGERGNEGQSGDRAGDGYQLDTFGPIIDITSPRPYELVAGVITIKANVSDQVVASAQGRRRTDPNGVDGDSVTAIIMGTFDVKLHRSLEGNDGDYEVDFDTRVLGLAGFPSLVMTANDMLGNRGEAGIEFSLDNREPVAALESRPMQFYRTSPSGPQLGARECSRVVNPLGAFAIQHGDVIIANPNCQELAESNPDLHRGCRFGLSFYLRARIQDRGNGLFPNTPVPLAGVKDTSAKVYMLDKTGIDAGGGRYLLVDDGTGKCMINPAAIPDPTDPRPDQAIVQNLVPAVGGEPDFSKPPEPEIIPATPPCDFGGWDPPLQGEITEVPADLLCGTIEPETTIWPFYTVDGAAGIWMLNSYTPGNDTGQCAGGAFDINNFSSDGPVCLAVVAEDTLGNRTVSQPIAICVESQATPADCVNFSRSQVIAASMCSDGCATTANPNRPASFGDPTETTPEMRYWRGSSGSTEEEEPGACCMAGGNCLDLEPEACDDNEGIFQGLGSSCASMVCPIDEEP